MLLLLTLIFSSALSGSESGYFLNVDGPVDNAGFHATSDRAALISAEEAGGTMRAQSDKAPLQEEIIFAQELPAFKEKDYDPAPEGLFSRAWSGVNRWWKGASWKKRIVYGTLGAAATASIGASVVWLGSYLFFKSINDGVDLISSGSGMEWLPTSSEVATTVAASSIGATASSVLTPAAGPPLGVCDLVETNREKYFIPGGAYCWGTYNDLCVYTYGCAYNGDILYYDHRGIVCRCHRSCNAPPKDLPCYYYTSQGATSCEQIPFCDKCRAHWCKVCNGWIPEAVSINDPAPSRTNMQAWLAQSGLPGFWRMRSACTPGSYP